MSTVAVIYPDATAFLGPVVATPTGFNWRLYAIVRDSATNKKETLQGYSADTIDADGLLQIRDKIIAATKAEAIARGFATLDLAVLNTMAIVSVP